MTKTLPLRKTDNIKFEFSSENQNSGKPVSSSISSKASKYLKMPLMQSIVILKNVNFNKCANIWKIYRTQGSNLFQMTNIPYPIPIMVLFPGSQGQPHPLNGGSSHTPTAYALRALVEMVLPVITPEPYLKWQKSMVPGIMESCQGPQGPPPLVAPPLHLGPPRRPLHSRPVIDF